jgi:hypothetical protein
MALESTIGGEGTLFVGEDKTLRFALPGVDMSGWATLFDVRKKDNSPEPAILSVNLTLIGTFNVVEISNTQRFIATLTDTQLNLFRAKQYRWSWKRMDDGSETVLAYGGFAPQKATAP